MTTICPFPPALLSASNAERLEFFQKKVIAHDHLSNGIDKALSAVSRSCGPKIVMITGPSGAGKSTLGRYLFKKLMESFQADMAADPGMVPVVGLNAIPPNGGCFNWKDFYIRLLERHGDVLLDRKMLLPRQSDLFPEMAAPLPIERSTTEALRRASERCMKLRNTKILIIDEAHHILMAKDPARLEFQFETLKSLTIESDVIILLVGTYRLLDIRDQSGQLVRRSEIIHFPRYNPSSHNDKEIFASVLLSFQKHLPLAQEPDLTKDVEYFFLKSGGCIGILKEWLTRCLEKALLLGMETFDTAFAEAFVLPNKSLMTIVEEAIEGELRLQDASLDALKDLMYQVVTRGSQAAKAPVAVEKPAKKRGRRVGERNPVRDRVGGHHD